MYNKISFNFGDAIRNQPRDFDEVFNSPNVRREYPYDPLVHLISDTQISNPRVARMASVHVGGSFAEGSVGLGPQGIAYLEDNKDYSYNEHKMWDIQEWFGLYGLPDRSRFDICWDAFYRAFPEQKTMLEWSSTLTDAPWIYKSWLTKPVPVGANPETVDLGQFARAAECTQTDRTTFQDDPTVNEYTGRLSPVDFTIPASVLLTPDGDEWNTDSESLGIFSTALTNLYTELSDKIEGNFRSYREVLDGKLAYSEPLFYRLQRVAPNPGTADANVAGLALQSYFFPATLLKDGFTYVDAQVKYGFEYDYTLYGYYLVIGNEYWYDDLEGQFTIENKHLAFETGNDTIVNNAENEAKPESKYLAENVWPNVQLAYTDIDGETILSQSHLEQLFSYAADFGMEGPELWRLLIQALERERAGHRTVDDYRATFGEEYYSDPYTNHHAQFAVNNRPHVLLVEADAFSPDKNPTSTKAKIVDSPPMPPDVEIVPYRSVNNKVLLRLNDSSGRYTDNPIMIDESDFDDYKDQIIMQNPSIQANRITSANIERDYEIVFDTDDYPRAFEIYRVDRPPLSYRSFANGSRTTLDNTAAGLSSSPALLADSPLLAAKVFQTANSFIDSVVPNKKYWYTFRTVDVHGNLSNPSAILQLEMVDTGNSIFPVIEEYSFLEEQDVYTKPAGRYLMIAPSSNQQEKHEDVTDAQSFVDKPLLGPRPREGMWGRKYKLRITSKLTGKKVDINFVFNQSSEPDVNNLE